jgi:putative ABC transport system ATP-binding protein
VLEFRDVSKHFRSGDETIRALDGLSLAVPSGEIIALFGPSGSGKSTLLRIAAAIEPPDSGAVLVDGQDITTFGAREASAYRLRTVGWVGQQADLIAGASALDNAAMKALVVLGTWRRAREQVVPILEALGLGRRLDQRVESLSTGEQQRVMLARALSTGPRILLADEPTGNLDRRRGDEVLELLRNITHEHDVATVLVTHDAHAIAFADRALTLEDGVLTEAIATS